MHVPAKEIRPQLEVLAKAPLPTRHGVFDIQVFRFRQPGDESGSGLSDEHVALVMGDVAGRPSVPVRIHSECITSEVFGSLKCDCKDQLEAAQAEAPHDMARSFVGLQRCYAAGDATPMEGILADIPVSLTSVDAYAEGVAAVVRAG